MKTKWMLVGICLVCGMTAQAVVTVENTVAAQTPGTRSVTIGYDVSSDFSGTVTITLKVFNGDTEIAVSSVTGDVGSGIAVGTGKSMTWDAGADWGGSFSSGLKFLVLADDGQSSTPVPVAGTVVVPAGTHGGTDPDFGAFSLTLTGSLFMDETETTKETWDIVYNWAVTNGYAFDNPGSGVSNHPVTIVSWYDAVKWCNARSELEGLNPCYTVGGLTYKTGQTIPDYNPGATGYRLPTGGEWEYAARGGTATRFPWGNTITHNEANYFSSAGFSYDVSATRGFHPVFGSGTAPVGSFAPNGYGLYEVVGNAAEWCWDAATDPGTRIQQNGSWIDGADWERCGSSFGQLPVQADAYSGFRSVRAALGSYAGTAVTLVDTRDYILSVVSVGAPASPVAGIHVYPWGSDVTCSVAPMVTVSGTVYVAKGWTGSGAVPMVGTTNTTGLLPLNQTASSIEWHWLEDNDLDGLPNDWELGFYGSLTGAVASADTDGDGYSAEEELLLGTDPTNGNSRLELVVEGTTNGTVMVSCSTVTGRTYTVEYSDVLNPAVWSTLQTFSGNGSIQSMEDASGSSNRYYRVRVESIIGTTRYDWKSFVDAESAVPAVYWWPADLPEMMAWKVDSVWGAVRG